MFFFSVFQFQCTCFNNKNDKPGRQYDMIRDTTRKNSNSNGINNNNRRSDRGVGASEGTMTKVARMRILLFSCCFVWVELVNIQCVCGARSLNMGGDNMNSSDHSNIHQLTTKHGQECNNGMYGLHCNMTCLELCPLCHVTMQNKLHCTSNDSCAQFTGRCDFNECASYHLDGYECVQHVGSANLSCWQWHDDHWRSSCDCKFCRATQRCHPMTASPQICPNGTWCMTTSEDGCQQGVRVPWWFLWVIIGASACLLFGACAIQCRGIVNNSSENVLSSGPTSDSTGVSASSSRHSTGTTTRSPSANDVTITTPVEDVDENSIKGTIINSGAEAPFAEVRQQLLCSLAQ